MPFTGGTYSRTKTFANGGNLLPGDLNSVEDDLGVQINTVMDKSGISDATIVRRGKSIIATSESRTNVAYGLLTTPDRVSSIVMPTDGIICVAYVAQWQESVANAGRAAIFLGANQIKVPFTEGPSTGTIGLSLQAARTGEAAGAINCALCSGPAGLASFKTNSATNDPVTTGQVLGIAARPGSTDIHMEIETTGASFLDVTSGAPFGGPAYIYADAGTYDISIQYKSTSGSVTVKNRKLWVWTVGF